MKKLLPALLVALAVLPGCLGGTDNNFFFEYSVDRLEAPPAAPIPITTQEVFVGGLEVRGGTATPCFTDQLNLQGRRDGSTLTLRLLRQSEPTCSDNRTRHHRWAALFTGIRSGTYTLVVQDETTGTPQVVFQGPVTLSD